jgi:hypothetical protein
VASAPKPPSGRKKAGTGSRARPRGKYKTTLPNGNVAFPKALNEITRKKSEAKALPAFKILLEREIRKVQEDRGRAPSEERVSKILQDCLDSWREKGFHPEEVVGYKIKYEALPRRRRRGAGREN